MVNCWLDRRTYFCLCLRFVSKDAARATKNEKLKKSRRRKIQPAPAAQDPRRSQWMIPVFCASRMKMDRSLLTLMATRVNPAIVIARPTQATDRNVKHHASLAGRTLRACAGSSMRTRTLRFHPQPTSISERLETFAGAPTQSKPAPAQPAPPPPSPSPHSPHQGLQPSQRRIVPLRQPTAS